MEKEIRDFIFKFNQMTKQEKKQIIKTSSIEFLTAVCLYSDISGNNITEEVKILKQEISKEITEEISQIDNGIRIQLLKNEIISILTNIKLEKNDEEFNLTEKEQEILDSYFEKTSDKVIENILEGIKDRLLEKNNRPRRRKNYFDVTTPAVIFPDCHHSNQELNYLEKNYRVKIRDLNLDMLGIVGLKIVPNYRIKNNEYKISYSSMNKQKKSKYCLYHYALSVTCDMEQAKRMIKNINN